MQTQQRSIFYIMNMLLAILASLVLGLVIVNSVTRPIFSFDTWAYHLPFSALMWNIGQARDSFILSDELAARYAGFPLLGEYLQGALWKVSGTIVTTTLISSVPLVAFIVTASRSFGVSYPVLVFGTMSVPLVLLHAMSGYVDLLGAVMVCFQILSASILDRLDSEEGATQKNKRFYVWSCVYVVSAAAACGTKLTGFLASIAISAFIFLYFSVRRIDFRFKKRIMLVVTVGALLSMVTVVRDVYEFGNPFYPLDLHIPILDLHFAGPERPDPEYRPSYAGYPGLLGRAVNWILSITEFDWRIRGLPPRYVMDLLTGGYWDVLVIGTLCLGVVLFAVAWRRNRSAIRANAFLLYSFFFLSIATSIFPQSHLLRYYLYWPILLVVVLCVLIEAAKLSTATRLMISLLYVVAFVGSERMLNYPLRIFPIIHQQDFVGDFGASREVSLARWVGKICLGPTFSPTQFMYSSVFHGGKYTVVQGWKGCPR